MSGNLEKTFPPSLLSKVIYADLILVSEWQSEVALRSRSVETHQNSTKYAVIRVLSREGWGIATTNKLDIESLKKAAEKAYRTSKTATIPLEKKWETPIQLAPTKQVKGTYKHPERITPENVSEEDLTDFLLKLKALQIDTLGPRYGWCEAIITYRKIKKQIITCEGTNVTEEKPLTDLVLYTVAKGPYGKLSTASMIEGGTGGYELILGEKIKKEAVKIAERAKMLTQARLLNPMWRGRKLPVILDGESAGALIHEAIGHMLEADRLIETKTNIHMLIGSKIGSEELTVIDNPRMLGGYGSYIVDDEGVIGERKTLVENGIVVNLFHTRWTAAIANEEPNGSARGLTYVPRSLMSNIYAKPSDWKFKEMTEDIKIGFYLEGLIKAELRGDDVIIEPEIAYLIEQGEIKVPVKEIKIAGKVKKVLQRIEGIGRNITFKPGLEKGNPISSGAPYMKISNVHILN